MFGFACGRAPANEKWMLIGNKELEPNWEEQAVSHRESSSVRVWKGKATAAGG